MAAGVLQYVIINMLLLLLLQSSLLTRDSIWKPTACNLLGLQTLVSCFITRHASLVTRHTSHVTRHTSHVTRHTSHVTRHTSHVTHRYFLHAAIGYSSGLALAMLIARCERMPRLCARAAAAGRLRCCLLACVRVALFGLYRVVYISSR